jgi:hypothetical protein
LKITIPISVGELLDKITILQIKSKHTDNEYVNKELRDLKDIANNINYSEALEKELYVINKKLWDVEDALRLKEKGGDFGLFFVELARDVYFLNDKRAGIKRQINEETNSEYKEIKCY